MTTPLTRRPSGRRLMLVGLGLALAGVIAYAVQLYFRRLMFPWYLPASAAIGLALVAASLWQQRSVWRVVALIAVVLLVSLELTALYAMRLPRYSGPIAVGRPFPAFEAKLADGTSFTQGNLAGDRDTALVFFRGRW